MSKQFWVNEFFVDQSRNRLIHNNSTTKLPPKALKVLTVLAKHNGEVVSHEVLMDEVWESSIVAPNTLQKAIAQLRKAFSEDSKQAVIINTHAKKGYSLSADVRWEEKDKNGVSSITSVQKQKFERVLIKRASRKWIFAAITVTLMLLLYPLYQSEKRLYNNIMPLTASDDQEYNAKYSPDGKFLVFNRYVGQCLSDLWAKDLSNNQERLLTKEPGHYSDLAWSVDGTQLAFILQTNCEGMQEQPAQCWQLQTLDFAKAWKGQTSKAKILDCANNASSYPVWLEDGRISVLQTDEQEQAATSILFYDARTQKTTSVPLNIDGKVYSFDYSLQTNMFASMSLTKDDTFVLSLFNQDGKFLSETDVASLPNESIINDFRITFSPDASHFLTEIDGQIYMLDMDGQLHMLHSDALYGFSDPIYHPYENKIAATHGTKDFDVGRIYIDNGFADISAFARSTEIEINAKFQPFGELISYISYRTGKGQVWLFDGDTSYQLTFFPNGLQNIRYSWSEKGTELIVNVNNKLVRVDLDGKTENVKSDIDVDMLMQWVDKDHLLVTTLQYAKKRLYKLNMKSGKSFDLGIDDVIWAVHSSNHQLIYVDKQKQFWMKVGEQTKPVTRLNRRLYGGRVVFKSGKIYGLNFENRLWQYDIENEKFVFIANADKDVLHISDVNYEQMLGSKFIGGRRELVELTH